MNSLIYLRFFAAATCLSLAGCAAFSGSDSTARRDRTSGSSLDNAPSGQNRYIAPPPRLTDDDLTTETTDSVTSDPVVPSDSTVTTTPPPSEAPPAPAPPPAAPASSQPSYGSPVPGKRGFVYPPGVEAKPENMVDVRDFTPGQKVRDPRTSKIFLVP